MTNIITHTGEVEVKVGNLYEFVKKVGTRAGHFHGIGEYLYVMAHTDLPVFNNEIGQNGNWWCVTLHGISPWTTLESCISRKLLRPYEGPNASEIIKHCGSLVGNLRHTLGALPPISVEPVLPDSWEKVKY